MKLLHVVFLAFLIIVSACGQTEIPEPGVLSPGQVNTSMVEQVVKVRGNITSVVENPGGLGGLYLKLANGGEIGVRIQKDTWESLDDKAKARFKQGEVITVEGVLFQAGRELVVIYGKTSLPALPR